MCGFISGSLIFVNPNMLRAWVCFQVPASSRGLPETGEIDLLGRAGIHV